MEQRRGLILHEIHRLSRDQELDNQSALEALKDEYNEIMIKLNHSTPRILSDILVVFPPEIWLQIIKESLPSSGYAEALLLLTTVSPKWRDILIATPNLWAHIQLRSRQGDSLAVIETCISLSGDHPLLLSIQLPQPYSAEFIQSLFDRVGSRLREVIIGVDSALPARPDEEILSVLSLVLEAVDYMPILSLIDLQHGKDDPIRDTNTHVLMFMESLPPTLRAVNGWSAEWGEFEGDDFTLNLEHIESARPLEDALPNSVHLPKLKSISISGSSMMINGGARERFRISQPFLNLTSICYKNAYRDALAELLLSVAPQLLDLELRIPFLKVPTLIGCLAGATSVRYLSIELARWRRADEGNGKWKVGPHSIPRISVPTLRSLALEVTTLGDSASEPTYQRQAFSLFIASITIFYKEIDTFKLHLDLEYSNVSYAVEQTLRYISNTPRLRVLKLKSDAFQIPAQDAPPIKLEMLEVLNVRCLDSLRCFQPANLQFLRIGWQPTRVDPKVFQGIQAPKLWISLRDTADTSIDFSPVLFPSVVDLTISVNPLIDTNMKLSSFPFLSTITISAKSSSPRYATNICYELLYRPENCPSLREMRFPRHPPDWDILFIMLEKRNFLENSRVSRICTITVPFIAHEWRAPLASLLAGILTKRPRNEDLLLGGASDLLLDHTIRGCYTCLANRLDLCDEPLLGLRSYRVQVFLRLGMCWTEPPSGIDQPVLKWIHRREQLLRKFTHAFVRPEVYRKRYCRFQGKGDELIIVNAAINQDIF